jgi:hypothetical protein
MATGTRDALLPAPGLSADLLELQRVHGSHEADLKFADIAFGNRPNLDSVEAEAFEDRPCPATCAPFFGR